MHPIVGDRHFSSGLETGICRSSNHLAKRIHKQWSNFADQIFNGHEYDRFFLDKPGALKIIGEPENLQQKLATDQLSRFEAAVDSASLIFAHSIVDAAALDYCKVTALTAPDSWAKYVENKRLSLAELKGRDYPQVLAREVIFYVEALERESLLMKIDRLFEVCHPPKGFDPIRDFRFDRERLSELDKLRHEIVHQAGAVKPLPKGADDLWFLEQSTAYLVSLINERFGLRIDPMAAIDALKT